MFRRSAALLLLTLAAAAPSAAATIPLIATGAPSPLGLPLSAFGEVALAADGRVAFFGSSTGSFRRSDGDLVRVVAASDELPGGGVVAGVSAPAQGPGGCVAVRAFLVGGGSRILRRCGVAPVETLVATGDPAPEGGRFAELIAGVAYGAGGEIGFTAILEDGSSGLFLVAAGTTRLVVRTRAADGTGTAFSTVRLIGVAGDGRVGFRGGLANGRDGLFLGDGSRLQQVVGVGDATPLGGTFRTIGGASMNDGAQLAFRAELSDGTAGVFRVDGGQATRPLRAIVREGEVVDQDGGAVRTLPSSLVPSVNAGGAVAFRASLAGGGSAVFVRGDDGGLARIVGAREQTAAGVLVRFRDVALADDGSLVIPASVPRGGPSLFVYRAGAVATLARIGDRTDLDTGLERFRFSQPSVRGVAEEAVFTGSRDGILVAGRDGALEAVAFVGGPTPLGGTFAGFDPPAADVAGVVAFGAEIRGSSRASRAIFERRGGALRVAARSSQRVRGGEIVDFFSGGLDPLTRPDVGAGGQIAFEATLEGKSPRAILVRRNGRPSPVVRAKGRAEGGGRFESFGTPAFLRGSRLTFVAQVGTDDGLRQKLFLTRGGRPRPVAAEGSGAPGRLGGRFDSFDPPDANDSLVAFRAGVDQAGREGVFLANGRALGLLVGTGDPAPDGGTFRSFSAPALGRTGAVFLGRVIGSPLPAGLYRVGAETIPAADAIVPAIDVVGAAGRASPVGGTIAEFGAFDVNRSDGIAVVADLVGASARSVLLLVDPGGVILP